MSRHRNELNSPTNSQTPWPLELRLESRESCIEILVTVRELRVHPYAQKRLVPSAVKKIMRAFDWGALRPLDVVKYTINGETAQWIIDGQTRWQALVNLGFSDHVVRCNYHTDCHDDVRAARLFLSLNAVADVPSFDSFLVEVVGQLPAAVAIMKMLGERDLRLGRTGCDRTLCCPYALKSVYARDEGRALVKTLDTILEAWGGAAAGLEGKIIEGLGMLYAIHGELIEQPALVKKLAKYGGGASNLLGKAKGLVDLKKIPLTRAVAEIALERYNGGRRIGRLDPL